MPAIIIEHELYIRHYSKEFKFVKMISFNLHAKPRGQVISLTPDDAWKNRATE